MNIMQMLKMFFPELMIAGAAVILIVNAVKKAPLSDSLRWIAIAMLYIAVLMRKCLI
jgi:hypothetical protein